jgi:FdhD protein
MTGETLKTVAKIRARKIDLDKRIDKFEEELVAIENPVKFFLNEKPLITIMALPSNLKEMAIGFLVDEGIVPSRQDILDIIVNKNEIWIKSKKVDRKRLKSIIKKGVIVTSCSSRADFYRVIGEIKKIPLAKNHYVEAKDILEMVKESTSKSALFKTTGGVHSASIFVDNILRGFAEDVGRHNAVDKVIGICLDNDIQLERAILITSGRQTADTIIKATRCKIPISVSMRAPLSSGIYAAELTGITLICFVRGQKMNIYSHPERVKFLKNI